MEKVYEMSPANKITVFPDGHAAETVLAVDLDDETREYLTTYPGTAQWVGVRSAEKLADDLIEAGRAKAEVPGLFAALDGEPADTQELLLSYSRLWSLIAAFGGCLLGITMANIDGIDRLNPLLTGSIFGLMAMYFTDTFLQKKRRNRRNQDEALKQTYNERLRNVANRLVTLDTREDKDVREALNHAEEIHSRLAKLRRYGLSTVDSSESADAALDKLLRAHIDKRTATAALEHYRNSLDGVDHDSEDEDIQYVHDLCTKQSRIYWEAKDTIRAAMDELVALETEVVKAERTAHAKLAAARIRHEEGTER